MTSRNYEHTQKSFKDEYAVAKFFFNYPDIMYEKTN